MSVYRKWGLLYTITHDISYQIERLKMCAYATIHNCKSKSVKVKIWKVIILFFLNSRIVKINHNHGQSACWFFFLFNNNKKKCSTAWRFFSLSLSLALLAKIKERIKKKNLWCQYNQSEGEVIEKSKSFWCSCHPISLHEDTEVLLKKKKKSATTAIAFRQNATGFFRFVLISLH